MDEVHFVFTGAVWAAREAIRGEKFLLGCPRPMGDCTSRGLSSTLARRHRSGVHWPLRPVMRSMAARAGLQVRGLAGISLHLLE